MPPSRWALDRILVGLIASAVFVLLTVMSGLLAPVARAQTAGTARVGFIHGTPDAPALDIYVDGVLAARGLAYGTATPVLAFPAGDRAVSVVAAGGDPGAPVVEEQVELAAGAAYAAATVGLLADVELRTFRIDLSPAPEGTTRVRVIHASPDAPSVDVATAGGDVLFAGATFTYAPPAVEVPAGTYDLEMRPAGTTDVALSIPDVGFTANTACTVFALGLLGDDGSLEILPFVAPLNEAALPNSGVGTTARERAPQHWPLVALAAGALAVAMVAARRVALGGGTPRG